MKCLCAETRHAARSLTRYYEDSLRESGLTTAQFELLATVSARPAISQAELAKALHLDQTTLSRNLAVAIRRKWIKRTSSKGDRRQSLYSITAGGGQAWQAALPFWTQAQTHMQRNLGREWPQIWASLALLRGAIPPSS